MSESSPSLHALSLRWDFQVWLNASLGSLSHLHSKSNWTFYWHKVWQNIFLSQHFVINYSVGFKVLDSHHDREETSLIYLHNLKVNPVGVVGDLTFFFINKTLVYCWFTPERQVSGKLTSQSVYFSPEATGEGLTLIRVFSFPRIRHSKAKKGKFSSSNSLRFKLWWLFNLYERCMNSFKFIGSERTSTSLGLWCLLPLSSFNKHSCSYSEVSWNCFILASNYFITSRKPLNGCIKASKYEYMDP